METLQMLDALSEAERYFQERGKHLPSKNHSITQARIGTLLQHDERFNVFSELSLELNEWKATPDLALYWYAAMDWLHDEVRVTEPPLLAIEIVSPSQTLANLVEKAQQYLAHGVQSAWIVQPQLCLITVMTAGNKPTTYTHGTFTDPATGIIISLDDIFR